MGNRKPRNKGMRRSHLARYASTAKNIITPNSDVLRTYVQSTEGLKNKEFRDTPAWLVRGSLRHSWIDKFHDVVLFRHPRRTIVLRFICREFKFLLQDGLLLKERRSGTFTSKLVAMSCYHNDAINWSEEWFPLSEIVMQDS